MYCEPFLIVNRVYIHENQTGIHSKYTIKHILQEKSAVTCFCNKPSTCSPEPTPLAVFQIHENDPSNPITNNN